MSINSRSDGVVQVNFSPMAPGDCLNDKLIAELARRMNLTLIEKETVGDAVVSQTPPENTSVIWYPADTNGFPIGVAYKYDPLQQQWVSTATIVEPPPTICPGEANLLSEAENGCWEVPRDKVESVVDSRVPSISGDSGNAIRVGSDGGWYVDSAVTGSEGQVQVITPVQVAAGTVTASGTIDLSTFVTVPTWATHAIIRATVYLDTQELETASTNKAYSRVSLNSALVSGVGVNPGPNTTNNPSGGDTNDVYVLLNGNEITYAYNLNQSPGWTPGEDEGGFTIEVLGFIRAGV